MLFSKKILKKINRYFLIATFIASTTGFFMLSQNTLQEKITSANIVTAATIPKSQETKNTFFTFAAIGDSEQPDRPNGFDENVASCLQTAKSMNPDFVVMTGDIITTDAVRIPESVRRIRAVKTLLKNNLGNTPFFLTFGYHDIQCGNRCVDAWKSTFFSKEENVGRELYHSFDYQNTHFVILSTDYPLKRSVDQKQLKWLDDDLSKTTKKHKIVFSHVPPVKFFGKSANDCHDMSCSEPARSQLISILKKHSVDLVISGHEHVFDHKVVDGIDYVLSGNATGSEPRYKNTIAHKNFVFFTVTNNNINLKAFDSKKKVIREITIK